AVSPLCFLQSGSVATLNVRRISCPSCPYPAGPCLSCPCPSLALQEACPRLGAPRRPPHRHRPQRPPFPAGAYTSPDRDNRPWRVLRGSSPWGTCPPSRSARPAPRRQPT